MLNLTSISHHQLSNRFDFMVLLSGSHCGLALREDSTKALGQFVSMIPCQTTTLRGEHIGCRSWQLTQVTVQPQHLRNSLSATQFGKHEQYWEK